MNLIDFIQFLKIRDDDSKGVMANDLPTWAVVATVDEPPALVQAFVAWHLSLGAAQVFIYCDRPDDPVQDTLVHLPEVTVVPCDDAHWLRLGKSRPRRHQVRQVRNARDAYQRAETEWLLHCDADEFLWVGGAVSVVLSGVPLDADGLILPVAERAHRADDPGTSIFEGAFRRPFREPNATGCRLFGEAYTLTYRGMTGHAQGKAFVRRGRDLQMSVHRPRPVRGHEEVALERAPTDALELLHFEGLTPAYWAYKLSRMVHALAERDGMPPSKHRRRQADALLAQPEAAGAIYRHLKIPDARSIRALVQRGLWAEPVFDPQSCVAQYFTDHPLDASPEAIDQWLAENKSRLTSYLSRAAAKAKGPP